MSILPITGSISWSTADSCDSRTDGSQPGHQSTVRLRQWRDQASTMAAVVVSTLALAGVGGLTLYEVISRLIGGGDEGPNLTNATIDNMEYDSRSKSSIIGVDIDMRKSGVMTEMMLVAVIGILATLCCLYQCCSREARMCHGNCYHETHQEYQWKYSKGS